MERGRHAMLASAGVETLAPPTASCWVCCEATGQLFRGGCGCRGNATCGHVACFVAAAEADSRPLLCESLWMRCTICKQRWTGLISLELFAALWCSKPRDHVALKAIGAALGSIGEIRAATRVFKRSLDETRRALGDDDGRVYDAVENLANITSLYDSKLDHAIELLRSCLHWRIEARSRPSAHSTQFDANATASNLANALLRSSAKIAKFYGTARADDCLRLATEAERVLRSFADIGDVSRLEYVSANLIYIEALARIDKLEEAVTLADASVLRLRRILGQDHTHYKHARLLRDAAAACLNERPRLLPRLTALDWIIARAAILAAVRLTADPVPN